MLKLMVESDPRMFVFLEKGDVRRREARVDESTDSYAHDPRRDIPFPKQWRSALRAKVVGHRPLFRSWTYEGFVRPADLDLLLLVICPYS
jgi:hypothetical protein